jgi:hypothetical protein
MTANPHSYGDPLDAAFGDGREAPAAYRALIRDKLDPAFVDALRAATNGGWALGRERFRKETAEAAGRRVAPLPRGPKPTLENDKRQVRFL